MLVLFIQKDLIKRLYSLLTIKESAASVPKNLEARRRLQFFTNSLFMQMPVARPASEMFSFRWDSFSSFVAPFTLVNRRLSCYVRFCLSFSYSYTNGVFYFVMQCVYSILLRDCSLQHEWTSEEKRRWYNYTVLSAEDIPRFVLSFTWTVQTVLEYEPWKCKKVSV